MSQTTEELRATLAKLPMQERAELANFLIHSLDAEWDTETEAAWDAELARRADDIATGKAKGESARSVFAKLREKYS
jgi:putative addiction module component (TIGR02574 family)